MYQVAIFVIPALRVVLRNHNYTEHADKARRLAAV